MITSLIHDFLKFTIENKVIIGVDYGQKKIGIAISSPDHTMALPCKTIVASNDEMKVQSILKLCSSYSPCAIVIGLPLNIDGTDSLQSELVKKFAEELRLASNLPIYLQDERLSSYAANDLLKSAGMRRKARNEIDDMIAASIILESTLNALIYSKRSSDQDV